MKTIQSVFILVTLLSFIACSPENKTSESSTIKSNETTGGKSNTSVFQDLSDRVEKIDSEKGLNGLFKQLKKEDGSNVYDDILKEIAIEDAESNGQVSKTIEAIIKGAESQMGDQDIAEMIGDAIEQANDYSVELEEEWADLAKQAEENGIAEDFPKLLEGLNDFIKTGGENGGLENLLEVVIKNHNKENPNDTNNPYIEKLKEIVNNDEKSAEKETLKILEEMIQQIPENISEADLERLKSQRSAQ